MAVRGVKSNDPSAKHRRLASRRQPSVKSASGFAPFVYVLIDLLRRVGLHLSGTATCGTIRLKLVNIDAEVRDDLPAGTLGQRVSRPDPRRCRPITLLGFL